MKRRVITLLIFLLLGAMVNVAVAWTLAASNASAPSSWETLRFRDSFDGCVLNRGSTFGSTIIGLAFDLRVEPCIPVSPVNVGAQRAAAREIDPALPMSELKGTLVAMEHSTAARGLTDELRLAGTTPGRIPPRRFASLFGWPLRACWYASDRTNGRLRVVNGVFSASPQLDENIAGGLAIRMQRFLDPPGAILPLRPIWPGFAINSLFYAAILWLLLALPMALRRWRRIKRGLCPACAYPVGTSDLCTECGHKLNITAKIARERMGLPPPATPALDAERKT